MKQATDFLPILLFFIAYKLYDIYVATAVVIAATVILVAFTWFKFRKIEAMQWITLILVLVMGGATLYFQDEQFIKWKLSVIEWLFGIAFLGSQYIGKKPFIERMMSGNINLPPPIWKRLNTLWGSFFIAVGCLNVYVMYHYNTDDWVTFKTFGVPILMLIFVFGQMLFLYKHVSDTEE
ncbi:MAG: septation protein A [Methylococcaceae bacterium]|jgi:intracellular septation protein